MKRRRHRAIDLFERGNSKAQIARLLGVERQSVGRWVEQHARGGRKALDGAGRLGRKPRPRAPKRCARSEREQKRMLKAAQPARRRDLAVMRNRRHLGMALLAQGKTKAQAARLLGVTRQSVGHWARQRAKGGGKALEGAVKLGRKAKVGDKTLRRLEKELLKGPQAHGFSNTLWTLERVREVLERTCAVRVHRGHVWHLLRALGWSRQRPQAKARERNEEAIGNWIKHTWPAVKKKPAGRNAG